MTRIFYTPPPGSEPFMFEKVGLHVIQPPDAYWKRIKEPYVIGVVMHPTMPGVVKKDAKGNDVQIMGARDKWVLDEKKNSQMKKGVIGTPKNYLDVNDDVLAYLGRAQFNDSKPYLKREDDLEGEHRRTYDEMKTRMKQELDELEAEHDAKVRRARTAIEAAEKVASSAENGGKEPAISKKAGSST